MFRSREEIDLSDFVPGTDPLELVKRNIAQTVVSTDGDANLKTCDAELADNAGCTRVKPHGSTADFKGCYGENPDPRGLVLGGSVVKAVLHAVYGIDKIVTAAGKPGQGE